MLGKYVVILFRLANKSYRLKIPFLPKLLQLFIFLISSCEISYKATIGRNLRLPHPTGIVIAGGAIIGENVTINQHVTIGGNWGKKIDGRAFPIIGSCIWIMPGSLVVGPIIINDNVIVGAQSLVTKSVATNSLVAGSPSRLIRNLNEDDIKKINYIN